MAQGDVVWVDFPSGAGRAQAGRRPAIEIQSAHASSLPTVLVVPLTTRTDALRFPGTFLIEPDGANGLKKPSVAFVFQTAAIDRRFLSGVLGRVTPDDLVDVRSALEQLTASNSPS